MATINNENLGNTRVENKTSSSISLTKKAMHSITIVSPSDYCNRCQKRVYITERIGPVKNAIYHKICFKCSTCNIQLGLKTYFTNRVDLNDTQIYCQSHVPRFYKSNFAMDNIHIQNSMGAQQMLGYCRKTVSSIHHFFGLFSYKPTTIDSLSSNEENPTSTVASNPIQLHEIKTGITKDDDRVESQASSVVEKLISSIDNNISQDEANCVSIGSLKVNDGPEKDAESVKIKASISEPVLKTRPNVLIWKKDNHEEPKVIYPKSMNINEKQICQSFKLLAQFRNTIQQQDNIDFVNEPFKLGVESTETMLIALNTLVESSGHTMYFTHQSFDEEDNEYRSTCGIVDKNSFFSVINGDKSLLTAKFTFTLAGSYKEITANRQSVKDFVRCFVLDLTKFLECPSNYIRVFDIESGSIKITFGVQANDNEKTTTLANSVQTRARDGFDKNDFPVLHHTHPQDYPYKLEPVLVHLQLTADDFQLDFNRDYTKWPLNESIEQRGNRNYYLPVGWYRHALNVGRKYGLDNAWRFDMWNGPDEWSVAYHGTKDVYVRTIVDDRLYAGDRDVYKDEAIAQIGDQADVAGIYLATHCDGSGGANEFATEFCLPLPSGESMSAESYKIVFQCRVRPGSFTEHNRPERENLQWLRVFQTDAIRPYGILLRKVQRPPSHD